MYLTQKNHLRLDREQYEVVKRLTKLSKNLYNYTLYTVRQYFIANDEFLPYEQAYHMVKDNENYKLLPSQVAQQTMKVVERNMRSFFHILREKQKGNYNRPASLPKYLAKDGKFVCIWKKDMFKIVDGKIRLSLGKNFYREYGVRWLYLTYPPNINGEIKEVRILPCNKGEWFEIEYVYEAEPEHQEVDSNKYLSIDLNVDNFAACCCSSTGTAFIIEGRGLKSYNQWWNKEKSKVQSVYDKQGIKDGSRMRHLIRKRKYKINDFMNKAVNHVIRHCIANRVGNIVVGELKDIKQEMNMSKKNNQKFWSIPYGKFKRKLKNKCEYYGINYIEVNEAHTSKCDALALEPVEHHNSYMGRRVKRGLFQSSVGKLINADVNGAVNILRKVVGDSLVKGILDSGLVTRPERIKLPFGTCSPDLKLPTGSYGL